MNHFEQLNKIIYEKLHPDLAEFVRSNKKIHLNRYSSLHEFLSEHDFKTGLEIGRCSGYSAVAFTTFYPKATLDSIDIIDRPQNIEFFEIMGVADRINAIVGDSLLIPKGKFYDYVLIDGDHAYEVAKLDWERIQSHVNSGSYVIFDDIHHVWGPKIRSVAHLWQEIEKTHPGAKKICRSMGIVKIND
jgi:predicted O-methyltransferase YrrM